jgi:hypothetical protein
MARARAAMNFPFIMPFLFDSGTACIMHTVPKCPHQLNATVCLVRISVRIYIIIRKGFCCWIPRHSHRMSVRSYNAIYTQIKKDESCVRKVSYLTRLYMWKSHSLFRKPLASPWYTHILKFTYRVDHSYSKAYIRNGYKIVVHRLSLMSFEQMVLMNNEIY